MLRSNFNSVWHFVSWPNWYNMFPLWYQLIKFWHFEADIWEDWDDPTPDFPSGIVKGVKFIRRDLRPWNINRETINTNGFLPIGMCKNLNCIIRHFYARIIGRLYDTDSTRKPTWLHSSHDSRRNQPWPVVTDHHIYPLSIQQVHVKK